MSNKCKFWENNRLFFTFFALQNCPRKVSWRKFTYFHFNEPINIKKYVFFQYFFLFFHAFSKVSFKKKVCFFVKKKYILTNLEPLRYFNSLICHFLTKNEDFDRGTPFENGKIQNFLQIWMPWKVSNFYYENKGIL